MDYIAAYKSLELLLWYDIQYHARFISQCGSNTPDSLSFGKQNKSFISSNYQLLTVECHFITDERTGEISSHSTNTLQVVLVTTFSVILSKEFGNFTISSLGMSVHYRNSISKLSIITIRDRRNYIHWK